MSEATKDKADQEMSKDSSRTDGEPPDADDTEPSLVEPTESEIAAWAEHEHERRQAWLEGPTALERADWARRERDRRLADLEPEARMREMARLGKRYGRETQLAAEGAMSLLWTWSRRTFAEFARAGLEWEEEAARSPRRRRIRLDEEDR
jgi:hypothetical protein